MNLADLLRESAGRTPEKAAILFQGQPIKYAELDREADRVAAGLAALGVNPGDRVAVLVHNVPHFIYAFYGLLRAGAVMVPLNTMFTGDEIAYILSDSGACAVVVAEPFAGVLDGVREMLPALEHVIVVGSHAPTGAMTWEQLVGRGRMPIDVTRVDDDLAVLGYTSGITGRPKGAMLSHRNLISNLDQMAQTPQLAESENDVILLVLPLFHIYALNVILGVTLRVGATAVLMERFDPVASLEACERYAVTVLFGAPPMFIAWLNTPGVERYDLSKVRIAVSGAAPLPAAVLDEFRRRLGITIWEGYGLTETAPAVTSNVMGAVAKPGSIGRPLPGVEVRIVDEEGDDVEDGDPGEIVVRGDNVFRGYWNAAEQTDAVFRDGWFRTGDIGYVDQDGYIFLVDRSKDLIIVSGFNVYPREIEEVLARHPKVAEAAVVGTAHPYTGEAVKAVCVLRPGEAATEEEIIDFCRRSLARFKCPQSVEFVSELPRHVTGKVLRRLLRSGPPEAASA